MSQKLSLGIIGAGRLGTAVACLALIAGYQVRLTNSGDLERLRIIAQALLPTAIVSPINELVEASDIILLALPLHQAAQLPADLLANTIVIDATNYWPATEGKLDQFESARGSSEILAEHFTDARLVKSLNHVAYGDLTEQAGRNPLRAIGAAGDDSVAKQKVLELVNDLGFDSVDVGSIKDGRILQPNGPVFDKHLTANELSAARG